MAHSKRNTSRSVFTSYERDMAKAAWASTSARLSRDSFLPFGSCYLCLEIARDPVSCSHGDIFCRECAVANLLAQKKEIKREEKAREKAEQVILEAQAQQDAEAQERAVKDFENIQAGLKPSPAASTSLSYILPTKETADQEDDANLARDKQVTKRKFMLDQDELDRIAKEDRTKAKKLIKDEKASKDRQPFFWTPSQTPDANAARLAEGLKAAPKKVKLAPLCPASADDSRHSFSLKSLIPLKFKEELDAKTNSSRRICPSCVKTLGNASRPLMAENCGHVICRNCAVKFMAPVKGDDCTTPQENACYVCDSGLPATRPDSKQKERKQEFAGLVELRSEGTGFSARGASKVERRGVAFQC
ncbi:RING finger domain-containing protein [Colletotrichum orchidophilum]|uniref:RING finger domain-containing protein n=1 Tax=Colletotrichum orchidophilum TaxID=1209926 RepID=A0A1G4BGS7_9PEZI|nr:RING finger domain-containing protein [Colletotrichum orchidophilum]OHF00589.1 RING finger domain-containing protein [Colletotrichum orchidophilum]